MGYPRKQLSADEEVELDLHPHWKTLVGPVVALLLTVPTASFAAARVPAGPAQAPVRLGVLVLALVLLTRLSLLSFLRWATTHYVLTDRRLILRRGIVARSGRDLPLTRINDISFSHTVLERVLGCGTLVVESAGERGQLVLDDVPRVEQVQRRVCDAAADAADRHDRHGAYDEGAYDDGAYDARRG